MPNYVLCEMSGGWHCWLSLGIVVPKSSVLQQSVLHCIAPFLPYTALHHIPIYESRLIIV